MYYLIDYENVNEYGLTGCEYLTSNDTLILFYNTTTSYISNKTLKKIFISGCTCECYALVKTGSNAIDFYICAKAGELFGRNDIKKLAVISGDKGYQALKDYWLAFGNGQQVLLKHNIEGVILELNESKELTKELKYNKQQKTIYRGVEGLNFLNKIRDMTKDELTNEEIYAKSWLVFEGADIYPIKQKELYLRCLKYFGRAIGLKIYQEVKAFAVEKGYAYPSTSAHPITPQKLRELIKCSLRNLVKKEKTRDAIADYILEDTSRAEVNSFIAKRYQDEKGREIINVIKPFIINKRGS